MKSNKPSIVRSNEIYQRAKNIIPAGSQTFSKGVTQFVDGFAPKYLARGDPIWSDLHRYERNASTTNELRSTAGQQISKNSEKNI